MFMNIVNEKNIFFISLLDHSSIIDDFEVIGNWKGTLTILSCRLICPAGNNSDAYPRNGITVPSVGELIVPSGMDLPLDFVKI